jgi:hypothetical protein
MKKLYKIVFFVQPKPVEGEAESEADHFRSEWMQVLIEIEPGGPRSERLEVLLAVANQIARYVSDQIDAGAAALDLTGRR